MMGNTQQTNHGAGSSRMAMFSIRLLVFAALTVVVIVGCSRLDLNGTQQPNQPPELIFVNVPAGGTQFNSNPIVYWYGTDIDGRVVRYDYAVLLETEVDSLLRAKGCTGTGPLPERLTQCDAITDDDFRWTSIFVDSSGASLPTQHQVNLFASFDTLECDVEIHQVFSGDSSYFETLLVNCISETVNQYMFIRATDDLGENSAIKYRSYLRTNHWPETEISSEFKLNALKKPFFSLPELSSSYSGIPVTWQGSDRQDYIREEPPLQYYWRVFGPFDEPPTIEDTLLPSGVRRTPVQESQSDDPNGGVWVADTIAYMYNLWRDVNATTGDSDTTRTGWFGLVVSARDDAFVPDPSPDFVAFRAIDAKFERDVLLVTQGIWGRIYYGIPTCNTSQASSLDPSCVHNFLKDLGEHIGSLSFVDEWDFEKDWIEVNDQNGGCRAFTDPEPRPRCFPRGPTLDELARHRLVIYEHEDVSLTVSAILTTSTVSLEQTLSEYLDIGGMMWLIDRTPFLKLAADLGSSPKVVDFLTLGGYGFGRDYFNLEGLWYPGWNQLINNANPQLVRSNDEFIGARRVGNIPNLPPEVRVDQAKVDSMYAFVWRQALANQDPPKFIRGVPNVSYVFRGSMSRSLYSFISWRPDQNIAHGQPVGTRFVGPNSIDPIYKTAWFGCPLYFLIQEDAYQLVDGMLEWFLVQPLEAGT
ncbi:MAG: hypothetical protein Kow0074_12120 [Candidatus Zixiibacteriota bacterium]